MGYAAVACRHFIGPKPLAKADPPRASKRGILAKASDSTFSGFRISAAKGVLVRNDVQKVLRHSLQMGERPRVKGKEANRRLAT
jgi:hypothetical protein